MKNRITSEKITKLKKNEIFVFGSNAEGNHIGGAAKLAQEKFGAVMGQSEGLQNNSYGINTMSGLEIIKEQTLHFIEFAKNNTDKIFLVTELGCGIAGYKPEEIAPLFETAKEIDNIHLPQSFWNKLNNVTKIIGFKGYDKNLKCRDFQYELCKEYSLPNDVKLAVCPSNKNEGGFHFCENPFDIWNYYPLTNSNRFSIVEANGNILKKQGEDSKVSTSKIKIGVEINLKSLIENGIKFIFEKVKTATSGYNANSATSGNNANSEAMGCESVAASIGFNAKAKASLNNWIVIAEWKQQKDYRWKIICVLSAKVDGKKIKADTFYKAYKGKLIECN